MNHYKIVDLFLSCRTFNSLACELRWCVNYRQRTTRCFIITTKSIQNIRENICAYFMYNNRFHVTPRDVRVINDRSTEINTQNFARLMNYTSLSSCRYHRQEEEAARMCPPT